MYLDICVLLEDKTTPDIPNPPDTIEISDDDVEPTDDEEDTEREATQAEQDYAVDYIYA